MTLPAYRREQADETEIAAHFLACDAAFLAALRERTAVADYAHKLHTRALRFEAWSQQRLIGLLAAYHSDETAKFYISNVSVLSDYWRQGIAGQLLAQCLQQARAAGVKQAELEVAHDNQRAIALYHAHGFTTVHAPESNLLRMQLHFIHP